MTKVLETALRLLARREHGAGELARKLIQRGYEPDEINQTIVECQRQGLQSDVRFVNSFCSWRIAQGYGPLRIRQELQAMQIDSELIDSVLDSEQDWCSHAAKVWQKKYPEKFQQISYKELQKRKKSLFHRGFSMDTILALIDLIGVSL